MKKDELINENAILRERLEDAVNKDSRTRKQLTDILKGNTGGSVGFSVSGDRDYTWMELSAEIGKLLTTKYFNNLEEEVQQKSCEISHLRGRVDELITKQNDNN